MEKKKIKVRIGQKYYTILHDENEEYIKQIEHYLNTKIVAASTNGIQLGEQTATAMAAKIGFHGASGTSCLFSSSHIRVYSPTMSVSFSGSQIVALGHEELLYHHSVRI